MSYIYILSVCMRTVYMCQSKFQFKIQLNVVNDIHTLGV